MNKLTLTIDFDDDGTAELSAAVEAERFSGVGSASFDLKELSKFCVRLGDYPLEPSAPPSLAGGYWDAQASSDLVQTNLAIRLTPYDQRGGIRISVELAEPLVGDDPPEQRRSVSTWFVVGYNDVGRFQKQLGKLLAGGQGEAVLTSTLE